MTLNFNIGLKYIHNNKLAFKVVAVRNLTECAKKCHNKQCLTAQFDPNTLQVYSFSE